MKAQPPVLASEVLREDLAPFEPGRRASRIWDVAFAGLYVAIGAAFHFGLGLGSSEPRAVAICLAAAAASCVTAIVPFPYLWRAIVGGLIGGALVVLGLLGEGPLSLLASQGSSIWTEGSRAVAFITVPATLLFRSHYRAFARGRVLAIALLSALPFVANEVLALSAGPVVASLAAGLALTALLSALGALVSTPTIAVSAWSAQALVAMAALDIGLRDAYLSAPLQTGRFAYGLTAVSFFAAVVPIALGLFQILASMYATEARIAAVSRPSAPDDTPPTTD